MQDSQKRLEQISKFVIFLPLIIVVVSILIQKPDYTKANSVNRAVISVSPQQAQLSPQNATPKTSKSNFKLDLKGPYNCAYKDATMDANISVKNKNVFVAFTQNGTQSNILVKGDCGYKWDAASTEGVKMCGIGQYLSIAEMFSSFGLDSVLSMVDKVGPAISIAPETINGITESCIKQEVQDSIFTVPGNIVFEDSQTVPKP